MSKALTMKEYAIESDGRKVKWKLLEAPPMTKEKYVVVHQYLPLACHDVLIEYKNGILLVTRNNLPAKNILWMIGGRIYRGMPIIESLQKKVKEECGLDIGEIREIGTARTLFNTDPFGHGKGTDTVNLVYFAQGKGKIKLDSLHKKPMIIKPKDYTAAFRQSLHPYVRDFMDMAMKMVEK